MRVNFQSSKLSQNKITLEENIAISCFADFEHAFSNLVGWILYSWFLYSALKTRKTIKNFCFKEFFFFNFLKSNE